MAYENGKNYYNYCNQIILRYIEDRTIFMKTLQILQYIQLRPDYPFCLDAINEATKKILGNSLYELSRVFSGNTPSNMIWDYKAATVCEDADKYEIFPKAFTLDVSKEFERDMSVFCIAVEPLMVDILNGDILKCSSIKQVTYLKNYNDEYAIRFIRNDNSTFDIQCNKKRLSDLITSLQEVLNNE